jgi:hypothetical protein
MKINTLIEPKEVAVVCEESGLVSMSYNVLLTTQEANVGVKPVVLIMTIKLALTYTNCGKTNHLMKTYHDRKREVPFMPIVIVKSMEPIIGIKTQPVKLGKIHVRYPCMICLKVEHK